MTIFNFINFDKLNINLGQTYAKHCIFPKIFCKSGPITMSRHIDLVLESTPTAASGQLVTAVTAQPVNSPQHGVSAAGQLVIRFWAVTSGPCDESTGSQLSQ